MKKKTFRDWSGFLIVVVLLSGSLLAQTSLSVWPMTGHDAQRTGLSAFVGPSTQPPGPSWTVATGAPIIGDLAISAEGIIYFTSDRLYALNPDGTPFAPPVVLTPLTSPAIDDVNGFIYVIAQNSVSGYDVLRFSKQLQDQSTVFHGAFSFTIPTSMTIGPDGALYFADGVSLIAVGSQPWRSVDRPCFGNPGFLAPTLGRDGSVYSMCQPGGGSSSGSGIYRFDGNTGAQISVAGYSRGGTELLIDQQNEIRAGFQAFGGAIFAGSYDTWDANLNQLTPANQGDLTTSRSALLPDGFSTVRIGFSFQSSNTLEASGTHTWAINSNSQTISFFTTVPTVDASGNVFVGTNFGVGSLSSINGSTIWFAPVNDTITTQPAISASGSLLVGSQGGRVYAFNGTGPSLLGTINVTTNNPAATFTITNSGNAIIQGSGTSFSRKAVAGAYSIQYGAIPGFIIPAAETKTLASGEAVSFTGAYIAIPPTLSLSGSPLRFHSQIIGTKSASQTVNIQNSGGGTLTFSLNISGDFAKEDNCPPSGLAAQLSCQVTVAFIPTDVSLRSGTLAVSTNAGTGSISLSGTGMLQFPLKGSTANINQDLNAYTAGINSVFDHSMQNQNQRYQIYGCDHSVTDFKAETGSSLPSEAVFNCNQGYSKSDHTSFKVNGQYLGAGEPTVLFYDGHPGFDYQSSFGNQAYAAASGDVRYPTLSELVHDGITIGGDPDELHVLELDVANDLKVFYLHLSTHPRAISKHVDATLENQNFTGSSDNRFTVTPNPKPGTNLKGSISISGNIAITGQSPQGVAVQLLGRTVPTKAAKARCVDKIILTNSSGDYLFAGLREGYYNIRPVRAGLSFNPTAQTSFVQGHIEAGAFIGETGNAGRCFPPHLHFEVQRATASPVTNHVGQGRSLRFIPVDPYGWHPDALGTVDPYFEILDLKRSGLQNDTLWDKSPDLP